MTQEQIIIEKARETESYLLKTRERLERMNRSVDSSSDYQFNRAKLIGMIDIMDALKIDRAEFNWIF